MKRRPLAGSLGNLSGSAPRGGVRSRHRVASSFGAAAACAILVGVVVPASSAPQSLESGSVAAVAAAGGQAVLPAASRETGNGAVPVAGSGAQPGAGPLVVPNPVVPQPGAQQPAAPAAPGAQQPGAPAAPGAPIAELRRASGAFEAAAGKASAPGARPGADPDASPPMPDFAGVAGGAALGELEGRFEEFVQNEWVQTGSVTVTGSERVEVVSVAGVPTHRFATCVDSSGIEIRDASGVVVLAAAPAGTRKAINVYDIQQQKGTWVVVGHSFPDSAAC